MAKVENIRRLVEKLQKRAAAAIRDTDVTVNVGVQAVAALRLHEMEPKTLHKNVPRPSGLGVFWGPPQYGNKFVEGPTRELSPELAKIINTAVRRGQTVATGLVLAGYRLQREYMKSVPVEYGNLRASAFVEVER